MTGTDGMSPRSFVALVRVPPCSASLIGSELYLNIPMNTIENIKLSYEQHQDDIQRNIKYEGSGVCMHVRGRP